MRQFGTFLSISCSFQRYTFSCVFCTILVSVDRILSLSVWGAPSSLGTKDKTERVGTCASFSTMQLKKYVHQHCELSPDRSHCSFRCQLNGIRPGSPPRSVDETGPRNNPRESSKGAAAELKVNVEVAGPGDDQSGRLGPSSL